MLYDAARGAFESFYRNNTQTFDRAREDILKIVERVVAAEPDLHIVGVSGRVKTLESSLEKFERKYREAAEAKGDDYQIQDHISDLIGIRVICYYADDVGRIVRCLHTAFKVVAEANKAAELEATDSLFGYRAYHLDLTLGDVRERLGEYKDIRHLPFEIQVRTVVQDAWSVLNHGIQYKRVVPVPIRRRMAALAALSELMDHEFIALRDESMRAVVTGGRIGGSAGPISRVTVEVVDFIELAREGFPGAEFDERLINEMVADVVRLKKDFSWRDFQKCKDQIDRVKRFLGYRKKAFGNRFNVATALRFSLYASDSRVFRMIAFGNFKKLFDEWVSKGEPA